MNKPAVSVIVAVYNAEKTLDRLLESLKAQTMQDFEVLLIDDGSTDSSGAICDGIAESDPRFKVFHKSNKGIGATRQFGIEHASGYYTIHADSDDWVEPDYLELLYEKAVSSGTDIVLCDILMDEGWKVVYLKQEPESYDEQGFLDDFLRRLQKGPCNKLIRREAYMNNGISYMKGLNIGEDYLFNLQLLLKGVSVSYVPKALYHCDTVAFPVSASRGTSLKKLEQWDLFVSSLYNTLPDKYKDIADDKNLDVVFLAIQSKVLSKSEFMDRYGSLRKVRWKNYYNKAFSIKLIIWTSLHVSYRLSMVLSDIKKTVRHIRTNKTT